MSVVQLQLPLANRIFLSGWRGKVLHTAVNFYNRKEYHKLNKTQKNHVSCAAAAAPCQPDTSVRMAGAGAPYG